MSGAWSKIQRGNLWKRKGNIKLENWPAAKGHQIKGFITIGLVRPTLGSIWGFKPQLTSSAQEVYAASLNHWGDWDWSDLESDGRFLVLTRPRPHSTLSKEKRLTSVGIFQKCQTLLFEPSFPEHCFPSPTSLCPASAVMKDEVWRGSTPRT